jgi:hypothetical protein
MTLKEEILSILGKYKVVGDTTFGLGYKEAEELADQIIQSLLNRLPKEKKLREVDNKRNKDIMWDLPNILLNWGDENYNKYRQEVIKSITGEESK